jgi:hypothetical protein
MVKRTRRRVLAGLGGLVAVLTLVVAGAAIGAQGYDGPARQVYQAGNPTCPDGTAKAGSTSIDGSKLLAGYDDGRIRITRRGVVNGIDSFDWTIGGDTSVDVMAVIVKGGDGAYIYFYDELGGKWADENLAPPLNNGGQAPTISHAVFCFDPKDAPNPTLTVEKSASGTSQITHSWAVDKQVKPAGAADSAYGDNTVLNLPDGGNGSVTWKVTVTHSQVQTYTVHGTITVSNDGVAVTGVDVSDTIPGAVIDCDGQGSTGITVPADGSVECDYTVTPGSAVPNNTATATWGGNNSASTTATIQWADPTEVGTPAHVVDDGSVDETLDTGDLTNNAWTTTYT